jgi:hypothetical protein
VEEEGEEDKSIVIRHSELVLFTKKFALEKADYEDKLAYFESENEMLRRKCCEYDSQSDNLKM